MKYVLSQMGNDVEMSKTHGMRIKIKEPMTDILREKHTKVWRAFCVLKGAWINHHLDCNFQTCKPNQSKTTVRDFVWLPAVQTQPKIELDVWDDCFSLVKKTTLWFFEASPVQIPPTFPLSTSLSFLPLWDCLLPWQWKKVQLCGVL